MEILVATDAWKPQMNGVVRTLDTISSLAEKQGIKFHFLHPGLYKTVPTPTYPELRLALPGFQLTEDFIKRAAPQAIHIATEGPVGIMMRRFCCKHKIPFTSSFTTRFPEYIQKRFLIPTHVVYRWLRIFHQSASVTMVATPSMTEELKGYGFMNLVRWGRGVDSQLFMPDRPKDLHCPTPIFMSMGRVAIEKNLEAFLSLDLPGTKVVVGDGPDLPFLKNKYPKAKFLGRIEGEELANTLAAADVFVFPSLTDTFGNVQLEALACGTPVAAFPVTGPKDLIGNENIGVLDWDLKHACLTALKIDRHACREFALRHTWDKSLEQFLSNLHHIPQSKVQN